MTAEASDDQCIPVTHANNEETLFDARRRLSYLRG